MPWRSRPQIVQDGIVLSDAYGELTFHTELNGFGLLFYSQSLLRSPQGYPNEVIRVPAMFMSEICWRLDQVCDVGAKYYPLVGYWGPLRFQVDVKNILHCPLMPYPIEFPYTLLSSPDNEVHFERIIAGGGLPHLKSEMILSCAQQIAWTFGSNLTVELLARLYSEGRQ